MKRLLVFVFVTILVSTLSAFAVSVTRGASEIHLVKHDISPALKNIKPAPRPAGVKMVRPNFGPPSINNSIRLDQAWQAASLATSAPAPSGQFEGVGEGLGSYNAIYVPPDTNGDVGQTQYVQTVNTDLAVFDKATGNVVLGPEGINTLWSGFGGGCETRNDGDPIVTYDQIANRWIVAQFTAKRPYLQCVAVSTSADATSTWYRYSYSFSSFPDYPKLAVWPSANAYFATYNMFGGQFKGANVCAMRRDLMLAGQANTQQCIQTSASYYSLLAADLDGSTQPAAGTDEWVMSAYNGVKFWRFHVDWANSANTKITGPTSVSVASYTESCSGSSGNCVPQKGTSVVLDTLGVHMMHRLAYRVMSGHDSIVANHTVSVSGINAVRWYEFRPSGNSLTVYQQGTFSPDSTHRWMGSIGMDKNGNIALGYSASSSTINPAIRYTGRLSTDALGQMQTEANIISGTGSQNQYSRWGDYSSIQTDPVDDCTFYYTTEYLTVNGSFNWHTRVAKIKLGTCP